VPGYSSFSCSVEGSSAVRVVYARQHRDNSGEGDDKTLFLANCPPGCAMRSAFKEFGEVEDVKMFAVGDSGPAHVAHVTFTEESAVQKVLAHDGMQLPEDTLPAEDFIGLERWLQEHVARTNVNQTALEEKVELFMETYETAEKSQAAAWRAARGQEDEEGFMMVQSKKQKRVAKGGEPGAGNPKRKRSKKKELTDFYIWQKRETKRQRIADLRESFEDDKKRIAKLKAARRFKPFGFE